MNAQLKTILLTLLTLSALSIAFIEMSGISKTAFINKYRPDLAAINESGQMDLKEHNRMMDSIAQLPKTEITFENKNHHFGSIKEGEIVRHHYAFINTGEEPLIITGAVPSCGCTVPAYPKTPVLPGDKGEIEIEFNSANQKGKVHKNIIIFSNAKQDKLSLSFDADVSPK